MSAAEVKFWIGLNPSTVEKAVQFGFRCPKKGTRCDGLLIAGRTELRRPAAPMWDMVDATPGRETFKPSINCRGCWHGFIENGRCVDVKHRDEP